MLITILIAYVLPMGIVLFCWWNLRIHKLLWLAILPVVNLFYGAVFIVYFVAEMLKGRDE